MESKRLIESARDLQAACIKRGLTVAVAESITAGLIGSTLASVPGSSAYFLGGVISYDTSLKERILGVPFQIIRVDGVVSQACAEAMAQGAQKLCGSRVSLAVTGEAGPLSSDPSVEPGTVWVAFCIDDLLFSEKLQLTGNRNEIRTETTDVAISLLLETILSQT
jgi:PncC family amidohydrolase